MSRRGKEQEVLKGELIVRQLSVDRDAMGLRLRGHHRKDLARWAGQERTIDNSYQPFTQLGLTIENGTGLRGLLNGRTARKNAKKARKVLRELQRRGIEG